MEGFKSKNEDESRKKGLRDAGLIAAGALAMATPASVYRDVPIGHTETIEATTGSAMKDAMLNKIPGVTIEDGKIVINPEERGDSFSDAEIQHLETMLDALDPADNKGINIDRSRNNPHYPVRVEFMSEEEKVKAEFLNLLSEATREEVRAVEAKYGKTGGSRVDSQISLYLSNEARTELAAAEAAVESSRVNINDELRYRELERDRVLKQPSEGDFKLRQLEENIKDEQETWDENHPDTAPSRIRAARDAAKS